jgi:hypothetical protein
MKGEGPIAEMIGKRFAIAKRRFGLDRPSRALDLSRFAPPAAAGDQMELFPTPL